MSKDSEKLMSVATGPKTNSAEKITLLRKGMSEVVVIKR